MKRKPQPKIDLETLMPLLLGVWRRFHKLSGPSDSLQTREFRGVVAAVKELQQIVNGGQPAKKNYFEDPNLLGAYVLYNWVLHYQQAFSLIGEIPHKPRRVLDLCSGPAPFAFGALKHGAAEVYALDQNATALQLGAEIAGRYGLPIQVRKWECPSSLPVAGEFDLIILGHCLEELFPPQAKGWGERQEKFLDSLVQRLTPHGHLLIVGSSLGEPNRRILQIREMMVKKRVPIQAPCVWQGECPALQTPNSPCYAQREFEKPYLIKELQRGAEINLGSLKMSYLLLRSPQAAWPNVGQQPLYRIISPPVESFHGKKFYLCGTDGKKSLSSRLPQHPPESKAFDFLRRGDLISIENPLENKSALEIKENTSLKLYAPAGKALPEIEN
jgi:SAM-dependent methyltransferase